VANTASTFGFKHIGYLGGGAPDFQLRAYSIASSYATAIGFGDPVLLTTGTNTGTIIQATPTLATSIPIVGIFQGCMIIPTTGGPPQFSPFYPAAAQNANATAYVIDAPNAQFLVASLSAAISSANIGWTVNFTGGVPTTTGGGYSIATIDQATATGLGTTANFQPFRIVSLYQGIGNGSDPTTNFNWAVVTFNYQMFRALSAIH
jgi:hypothetical protein